jgi:uncharacterized protein YecE (DUF72 family)
MPDVPIRLGTMGFGYADWDGVFYPRGLKGPARLGRYAAEFDALELDSTFHAVPALEHVKRWGGAVPAHFRFTAKMPRAVTHADRRLDEPASLREALAFVETMRTLGEKLSAVLVQFPPSFAPTRFGELANLLDELPGGMRYAIELRHDGWWHPMTAALLRGHNAAWVCADETPAAHLGQRPSEPTAYQHRRPILTADWFYLRWIGVHEQFGSDSKKDHNRHDATGRLAGWADHLRTLTATGRVNEVLGFVNNDYSGHSPTDVRTLRKLLGQPEKQVPPASLFDPAAG